MASGYTTDDPTYGRIDLDDKYVTDSFLVDQFVGSTLYSWGANTKGSIGDGTTVNKSSPIQIGSDNRWRQVVSSQSTGANSYGIKNDGTLWAWGWGSNGALGDGTTVDKSSPIQIGTLTNWKQITTNSGAAASIKTDGTLWAWGYNGQGTVGDGTTANKSSPVQIGTLTNWKQVSGGASHIVAVKTDGTLWAWGGGIGITILGDGTTVKKSSPVQIGTMTNWKLVASSGYHNLAIKTDGSLWSWGYNIRGQLGDGTTTDKSSPVQVGTLTNWKQVSASQNDYVSAAIKTDGTLWIWGAGGGGTLGSGDTLRYSSPIQIGSLTNWKLVSCGNYATFAIKTDGTLWAWGNGINGALGNGGTVNVSSPIQLGSLTNWRIINAGAYTPVATTFRDIG